MLVAVIVLLSFNQDILINRLIESSGPVNG